MGVHKYFEKGGGTKNQKHLHGTKLGKIDQPGEGTTK